MKITVCIVGARTALEGEGWSAAEMHCLPQIAVYVGGGLLLLCVIFTILGLVMMWRSVR
jgi:hypothetical protein